MHASTNISFHLVMTLTSDLENPFCNSHLHDEYLWQVSLKSVYKVDRHMSHEISVNRCMDIGQPDSIVRNIKPLLGVVDGGMNKQYDYIPNTHRVFLRIAPLSSSWLGPSGTALQFNNRNIP